ncbi:NifB/NifX family molybdenum-iron cluster-binding protein [Candidatus Woesearchaeota archaeon]|nr:NifB/NifX family molybdenum-iron cluster-binding protein [Candidatus Woesearchaeota archaeon]
MKDIAVEEDNTEKYKGTFDKAGGNEAGMSTKGRMLFPLIDDNGMDSKISLHFGHAPFFGVYDLQERRLEITRNEIDHADPQLSPVEQITARFRPAIVFAHDIGGRAIMLFNENGIKLKTGPYDTAAQVIHNLDKLSDLDEGCGH